MKLFGYWRSSATYRVRIALALKGISVEYHAVNLLKGEQAEGEYRGLNAQALVPTLQTDDGAILTQSLAIIEYLEEVAPTPALLPDDATTRAKIRAFANALVCEAQPFMNLRVQQYLKTEKGFDDIAMSDWLNKWPGSAMRAAAVMIAENAGPYCFGGAPTLADVILVPQAYAAQRFGIDFTECEKLVAIADHCNQLDAFKTAHPDNQSDAPPKGA